MTDSFLSRPTLFEAAAATEDALRRVEENADADWKLRALQAIRKVAEQQPYLVVDDTWKFVEAPREKRAMGAMMQRARKEGWIAPTSEYRPSTNIAAHLGPRRLWKSLIYNSVGAGV